MTTSVPLRIALRACLARPTMLITFAPLARQASTTQEGVPSAQAITSAPRPSAISSLSRLSAMLIAWSCVGPSSTPCSRSSRWSCRSGPGSSAGTPTSASPFGALAGKPRSTHSGPELSVRNSLISASSSSGVISMPPIDPRPPALDTAAASRP
jgi:hypothetical protein